MTTKEALEKVEQAFASFDDSSWKKFLEFCSQFTTYSENNQILIFLQNPEAMFIKGYRAWQKLERQVRKGEKAIKIFAPIIKKEKEGSKANEVKGFRIASVFDISQTDGDPVEIPTVITGLKGTVPEEFLHEIMINSPIPIQIKESLEAHGCYQYEAKKILIRKDETKQMFKTMLHELAHYFHHESGWENENDDQKEFLAESVACAVSHMHGIDTSDYSIQYIKNRDDDFDQFRILQKKILKCIKEVEKMCVFKDKEAVA